MRQGKTISNYRLIYEHLLTGKKIAFATIDTAENIKENFKYFLNVKVNVKLIKEDVYEVSLTCNYITNENVKSIYELLELANSEKSVYVTLWRKTKPAAFMIHMPLVLLDKWIKNNYIYTITKKESNEKQKG